MKRDWFIFEEIPRTIYHLFEGPFNYWGKEMKRDISMNLDIMFIFKKGDVLYGFTKKKYSEAGKRVFNKVIKKPDSFVKRNNITEKLSKQVFKSSKKLHKLNLSKLTDKQLEKIISSHMSLHQKCHASGMLVLVLEWEHELLSTYLKKYLDKKIREKNLPLKTGATFSLLTIPRKESFQLKEEKKAIKIALKISRNPKLKKFFLKNNINEIVELLPSKNKKLDKEIHSLYRDYLWLPYMYVGPAWNKDYFVHQIKALVRDEEELPSLFKKMKTRLKEVKQKQKTLIKQLLIDKKHQTLFDISRQIVYLKSFRKDALYFSFFSYEPLLKEIGKRLGLSLNQLRVMWPSEYKKAILKKEFDSKELNERFTFSVYVCIDEKDKTLTGKEAQKFHRKLPNPKEYKISELNGSTAVPGMVKGIAKIINVPEDMKKMNQGDILVSHATNPNLVPAMKKASAIVTDIGGVTCHAAIVSRELNIPCVIGTKIATKVLKDGDLIDVNANHGVIKKVKK